MVFNDFSYSASTQVMVKQASKNQQCGYKKTIRIQKKIIQKSIEACIQCSCSGLDLWGRHLGTIFPKLASIWHQVGCYLAPSWSQLEPSWPPVGPKLPPSWPLVGSWEQSWSHLGLPALSRYPKGPSRDLPGTSQGPPRDLPGTLQGPSRDPPGCLQEPSRYPLGLPRDYQGIHQGHLS